MPLLASPIFFQNYHLSIPDFIIRNGIFLCYRVKNGVTGFSGFCNPETSKNRARYMMFPDYIIRKPPKHPFST
ncbi:hypothetical protein MtrunA17_Chr5g0414751 [Medicago truncatula]|uniref:Uncharacterized protein n=1 Tax=Medicago truncatula TaxID=3880 RepID=A0A396HUV4_MEDTR|nr:hypothetical protein MtrunA17_Chr5g0414751 [Medicago truncatula]